MQKLLQFLSRPRISLATGNIHFSILPAIKNARPLHKLQSHNFPRHIIGSYRDFTTRLVAVERERVSYASSPVVAAAAAAYAPLYTLPRCVLRGT